MKRWVLLLMILFACSPAYASRGINGWAGVLLVLASIPIAMIGLLCTVVSVADKLFKKPRFFWIYTGFFIAVPFLAIGYLVMFGAPTVFDQAAIDIILVAEPLLLVVVLLPEVVQYWRRNLTAGPPSDH